MNFKELNEINHEKDFLDTRLNTLKQILIYLTIGGCIIVFLWQILQKFYYHHFDSRVIGLSLIAVFVFIINLLFAIKQNSMYAHKFHLLVGFYVGASFCMLMTIFTGASESPYWFGLFFILIAWFVLVPFAYRELIFHSSLFVFIFLGGLLAQTEFQLQNHEVLKIIFLYFGTLFIGFYASIKRNRMEAEAYKTYKILSEKNKVLSKYLLVLEQAPGSVFIIDKKMNFEYINPCFTQLSGYTKEELLHKSLTNTVYNGKIPDSRIEIIEALRNGDKWQGELLTFHKSGKTYWANTIAAPYKDEFGNVDGYIVIQQDITQHKIMENAIQESEKLYRALIERANDGVALTQNGKILLVNKAFCDIFGYSEEEIKSITPADLIAPEDKERVFELHYKRMRGEIDSQNYEAVFLHKNGTRILNSMSSTTVKVNGENASFVTLRDITAQRALQIELAQSEQKYRELAEMLPQTVYELDLNGRQTYMNQAGIATFRHTKSAIGRLAFEFIIPEDHQRMRENIQKSIQNKDFKPGNEYTAVREDGSQFPVIIYSAPVYTKGVVTGTRGIIINISERKSMENELRENEEKYRLLFEAESDAIFMVDVDSGDILDANPAATTIYGYSHDEFLLMKNTDVSAEPEKTTKATYQNEKRVLLRYHRKKDHTIFPVELSAGFALFKKRKIQIVTSRDITENKKMQDDLIKSEQRFRELTEMLPQTVYEHDLNGKITYLNQAGKTTFGIDQSDVDVNAFSLVASCDLERMKEDLKNNLSKKNQTRGNIYTAQKRSGESFPVMIFAAPMISNDNPTGIRGIVLDMTEHISMQKALRESEEKYRSLIENATDGIVITQKGILKFANEAMCHILQYSLNELIEQPYLNYVLPDDQQIMIDYHQRRMNGDVFTSIYRSRLIRKDGKTITTELNARTSVYNGNPAAFIVIRDITERLNIENELTNAKNELELLNKELENRVIESSQKLAETRTQLINLQRENLQSQFEVLRQQVNPHFLFNSLNVLTSLIKLEPDLAEKFSEHLSKVYRYVLENKDNELVDLKTELNFLSAYIFLLNIRFVGKLKVNINISDEQSVKKIIPLAMQLLIENAIKHNIMSKSKPLSIDIYIDDSNYLNIINNLQERPSQLISTGVGLKNIQNRYFLLNSTEPIFVKNDTHFIAKIPLID